MTAVVSDNAMALLNKRYLVNGESVDGMFHRVADGNEVYKSLLQRLCFIPNSPTLFNAGLKNGCTLSACFVFDVADEMRGSPNSIVATRDKAVAVAKAGGGVGYYFGHLRPKGSPIKSVHRVACGPIGVLKDYHAISQLITQGGKRELAQMGILPVSHKDIKEFIHCKDEDPQSLSSFNISVGWHQEWISKVDFSHKREKEGHETGLWWEQCRSAWKHGCPGMWFPDTVNRWNINKHLGLINAPNPCGETPNRNNEPCNLGSLSLGRYYFHGNRSVNWNLLEEDTYNSTLFLDDILDRNQFPHPDIGEAALLTRKLGLGVMGWADLLGMLHIHYDTLEAVQLGEKLMKFISDVSHRASEEMAKKKGPYKGYDDKTEGPCRRNETNTSIAPTGSIAIVADCKGHSIEPWYAAENERTTADGLKLIEGVPGWIHEKLEGFIPKTAHQISPEWHVRHQAAFQKYTDLGVSKTVNMPNGATVEQLSDAYRMMYELGCKGGTIFRDGCRKEQVLVDRSKGSVFHIGASQTGRRKLPRVRSGLTYEFKVQGMSYFVTVNIFEDGMPGEVFIACKEGHTVGGLLDAWSISMSVALQNGVPLRELIRHHKGTRFEPCGPTADPDIPVCSSIPDYVARLLEKHYLGASNVSLATPTGMLCPECGKMAVLQGGCLMCTDPRCGWTRCG
jgi:ribonucleoside-diphosphate reductase alpha chain